jgi:hypothetical protein
MEPMLRTLCCLLSLSCVAFGSATCPVSEKPYQTAIDEIFAGGPSTIMDLVNLKQSYPCFLMYVLVQEVPSARGAIFLQAFLDLQKFQNLQNQTGSSSATGGSTSLVSKGATARLISVASEYGALTETTSNQTVTVQGSLDGPLVAATRQYLVGYCPDKGNGVVDPKAVDPSCLGQATQNILSQFSYGVTFNTGSGSQTATGTPVQQGSDTGQVSPTAQPITFTASGRQIASITGRYVVMGAPAKVTSDAFNKAWTGAFTPAAGGAQAAGNASGSAASQAQPVNTNDLRQSLGILQSQLQNLLADLGLNEDPGTVPPGPKKLFLQYYLNSWWSRTKALLEADLNASKGGGSQKQFESDLDTSIQDLYAHVLEVDPNIKQQAGDILRASSRARFEVQQVVNTVSSSLNKPMLTVEYLNTRPQNQNSYSTAQVIFEKVFGTSRHWSVTANGAVAFNSVTYAAVPGSSTFRDAQVGVEVKYTFGALNIFGNALGTAAVSGTYYYQDQHSPSVLNVTPGTPLNGITITGLPSSASQVFAQPGNINIGQLKIELGGGSSIKFPMAISYSNRTELVTKPELRGQIGISYNFDSLFTGVSQSGPK